MWSCGSQASSVRCFTSKNSIICCQFLFEIHEVPVINSLYGSLNVKDSVKPFHSLYPITAVEIFITLTLNSLLQQREWYSVWPTDINSKTPYSQWQHWHADRNALASNGPEAFKKTNPWFCKPQPLMMINVRKQSNRKGMKTTGIKVCNGSDGSDSIRLQSLLRHGSSYRLRN